MSNSSPSQPRILIVLPTLGQRTALLRKTLESIKDQGPNLYDIVMVFPLKNEDSAALANEFGATSIDDPGGLSAAVNAGIAQAKPYHEYIGWLGDDDLLTAGSLKTALCALDSNTSAVLAFGYCDYINDDGQRILTSRAGKFAPWIMTWGPNLLPLPGILFRLSTLQKAGEFDVNNKYSMDLDMLLRLRKYGKFVNTKKTLAAFRWHPSSTTVANRDLVVREAEMVKRRYLPVWLRPLSPIWDVPVRYATKLAASRVNYMAQHK